MMIASLKKIFQGLLEKSGWLKLEKRERGIILAGLGFLLCLALFHFVVSPLALARQQMGKAVVQKQADLKKIEQLQAEYHKLRDQSLDIQKKIAGRNPAFTLFSFVEEQAAKAQVKGQVRSMTPSSSEGEGPLQESRVDLKLEQVSLSQLVDFLQAVESPGEAIIVKRISIQENSKTEGLLDIVMQIITFVKKA
jgi:general secretion pathway protein M